MQFLPQGKEIKAMKSNITKEFLENHFKFHNKLTVYQGHIPLTITKEWHLHFNGGHYDFDVQDCEDFADLCRKKNITLEPTDMEQ